ncbi:hypothetical protein [Lentzea sp. NEAU-D7]|uniref:hypothetical protein n=1 Tax=Lentzea sp. NEAU-D7 TaxID=2994667 RepID=UPI00224A7401|nr:hypothetical protein [Lentzea sp. NEAU-D7]MCX2951506.1 hypothetical protein [Lentzea sp. NEAU-D7]
MPARCAKLLYAIDATDPSPATELPAAAHLIADHGRLVLAVLHPPPGLTLNARLIAWQQARRHQITATVLAPLLSHPATAGLSERNVRIHTAAWTHRRGPGSRHRRVATALLRLCRSHDADLLVLPAHSRLLTPPAHRYLLGRAPAGLRIRRADEHVAPTALLV